jgi:uncharacterized membrane protein
MNKQTRWLDLEIKRWTEGKIISAEQAASIRALYPEPPPTLSWGLIVFSSIGAVVVGLGMILVFAHNWHAIPRFGKLGIIFGALLAAHAGGLAVWRKVGWRRQLGEALCLFGTMAFGAGIWLVAQLYNIDEHFPAGFLIWGLGALAMAWALRSVPQGILAALLLSIWGGFERFEFQAPVDWSPLLVLVGLVPLAWHLRSGLLTAFVLAALSLLVLCNESFFAESNSVWLTAYALSVLLVGAGILLDDDSSRTAQRKVITFFGVGGFVFCTYFRSFSAVDRWVFATTHGAGDAFSTAGTLAYHWLPFVAGMALWVILLVRVWRGVRGVVPLGDWIYPVALIFSQFVASTAYRQVPYAPGAQPDRLSGYSDRFIVFNLICLALATAWMVRGCRYGQIRPTILGSLFFALIVVARYFDLPGTLATRGMVFIVLGAVLFAEGFYYRKLRREAAEEENA